MARLAVLEAAERAEYPLFVPFIMAGDPNVETTIALALKLQETGAHILELGIPYSDPLADGPVLQRSAKRAIDGGMSLSRALSIVPEMRRSGLTIPVIIFTYYNPVMRMGEEIFLNKVKENEADGILIPDLPFEESTELSRAAKCKELANISLVAPTSAGRIEKIAKAAEGFLYCVSSLGVTGTRDSFPPEAYKFIETVKKHSDVPVAVGFGISNNEQVKKLEGACAGVIVGSAIMKKVEEKLEDLSKPDNKEALNDIKLFVSSIVSS
ncbi:tryptophan synthase subunit alpha [Alteribacillus sp. HJP-4]|uniref:tryptophan synthase subunit alpha n=1 Tax=Alteribacillus sp. HJP-4 TaxID=2775394 RepID=UPI0035CD3B27